MVVLGLIGLAVIVLVLIPIIRMGWRLMRGNEEMVPAGSWGRQFRCRKEQRPS